MFPVDVILIIADYCAIPQLLSWIPRNRLKKKKMRSIGDAYDAGFCKWKNVNGSISSGYLLKNEHPRAVEMVCEQMHVTKSMTFGWSNPALLDALLNHPNHGFAKIDWYYLSANPSKRAIELLMAYPEQIVYSMASKNPGMIPWLRTRDPELAHMFSLYENPHPTAIEIISQWPDQQLPWNILCRNPHPLALEKLRMNQDRIDWDVLSSNKGIFETRRDPAVVRILELFVW